MNPWEWDMMIAFAKYHVKAALKQVFRSVKVTSNPKYVEDEWGMNRTLTSETTVDGNSIFDAYPLTNIK